MTSNRLRTLIGGGAASGILAAVAAVAITAPGAAVASEAGAPRQAEGLGTAAALVPAGVSERVYAAGAPARARAEQLAGQVPLPDGEAFDDIHWDAAAWSESDIQGLLEANAACKWWMEHADAPSAHTERVVAAIPTWPSMRDGDRHEMASMMARDVDAPSAVQLLKVCRHELG